MNAIELLCDIIAQGTMASAASYRAKEGYRELLGHGYLQEAGIISSVTCAECDVAHDAEIIFESDQYGYFCPELGFVPVARDDIVGLTPKLPWLVDRLADSFACKRRRANPLHGQTWRIGATATWRSTIIRACSVKMMHVTSRRLWRAK